VTNTQGLGDTQGATVTLGATHARPVGGDSTAPGGCAAVAALLLHQGWPVGAFAGLCGLLAEGDILSRALCLGPHTRHAACFFLFTTSLGLGPRLAIQALWSLLLAGNHLSLRTRSTGTLASSVNIAVAHWAACLRILRLVQQVEGGAVVEAHRDALIQLHAGAVPLVGGGACSSGSSRGHGLARLSRTQSSVRGTP